MAKLETAWTGISYRYKEEAVKHADRLKAEGYKTKIETLRGNGGYRVHVDRRREIISKRDMIAAMIYNYDGNVAALKQKYEEDLAKMAEINAANVNSLAELTAKLAELPTLKPKK